MVLLPDGGDAAAEPVRVSLLRTGGAVTNFERTAGASARAHDEAQCTAWASTTGLQVHCLRQRERRDGQVVVRDGSLAHLARVWRGKSRACGARCEARAASSSCVGGCVCM